MDSRWLVPIRLGIAGVILLIYSALRYREKVMLPWKTLNRAVYMLIYGVLGVSCCQFFYFLTIELSTAAIGTILQDQAPIFVLLFTCVISKRLPKFMEICSIVMALFGVFLLTTHGDISSMNIPVGALITGIISGICVAVYNILAPKMSYVPVIIVQGWSFLLGGIAGTFLFKIWTFDYVPNIYGLMGIAFVVLVGNVLAFTLYISGVQMIGPGKAILYSFAEPITAAVISAVVLGSVFTIYDAVGFILIFAMLWLISMGSRKGNQR